MLSQSHLIPPPLDAKVGTFSGFHDLLGLVAVGRHKQDALVNIYGQPAIQEQGVLDLLEEVLSTSGFARPPGGLSR